MVARKNNGTHFFFGRPLEIKESLDLSEIPDLRRVTDTRLIIYEACVCPEGHDGDLKPSLSVILRDCDFSIATIRRSSLLSLSLSFASENCFGCRA